MCLYRVSTSVTNRRDARESLGYRVWSGLRGSLLVLHPRVLDLSVLKMEPKTFDLDSHRDRDSLTSFTLLRTEKARTEPKLLWLPYFPILLIYFWTFLLPEISYVLCDAASRQYLIDQMTICALYTTDMIILLKVGS